MATLHVRNVPEELYEQLRRRAEENGRSIGAETVHVLHEQLAIDPGRPVRVGIRRRRRRGPYARFTAEATETIRDAQNQARSLRHDFIGTEHLLLALMRPESGPVAEALASLGLSPEKARAEVLRLVESGETAPTGQLPFTARAKKTLDLAIREAAALRDDFVAPEHIALALLREGEGVGSEILRSAQPDGNRVRRCLKQALGEARTRPIIKARPFKVIDLNGGADEWEAQLNDAANEDHELVAIVDRRAILKCS